MTRKGKKHKIPIILVKPRLRGTIPKNITNILRSHFESFIARQIKSEAYSSVSEIIKAGLSLLEKYETGIKALGNLLEECEKSGL